MQVQDLKGMSLGRSPAVLPQISGKQIPSKVPPKDHADGIKKVRTDLTTEPPEASSTDESSDGVPRRSSNPISNKSTNCHRSSCASNNINKYVYDSPQGSRFQNSWDQGSKF